MVKYLEASRKGRYRRVKFRPDAFHYALCVVCWLWKASCGTIEMIGKKETNIRLHKEMRMQTTG